MTATRRAPTIVVLRALGLGDLLTAVPAVRALADAFPDHRRLLLTTPGVAPLAVHIGAVDDVVPVAPLAPVTAAVAAAGGAVPSPPDVAVNLHGRGPQSTDVLRALSPRRLVAFGIDAEWAEAEHEVARWCRLLQAAGIPTDPGRLDIEPPDVPVPDVAVGATVVHPGAASGARRWPVARWAAVARAEAAAGRAVVVTGSRDETPVAERVAAEAGVPPDHVLAGRTDVLELAAVVAAAGRVVCGDTGVAHLATALRRPSVVLFGPVPPSEWGPPADRPWHRALWAGTRRGDPHADAPDPALLALGVDDVVAALDGLPEPACLA